MKKQIIVGWLLLLFSFALPAQISYADAQPGDVIITLGENLTPEQQEAIKQEMGYQEGDTIVTVSNAEEHKYLGQYISKAQIGSKAISSAKITLKEAGSGLNVETKNISWVTEDMYSNSLITAGVKDADIYVTAPFEVSGTAGLTGILKAYEVSGEKVIPEEQKQIANEEMVKTAQLGERIGADAATALFTRIKEEIANNPNLTDEQVSALIDRIAAELGIQLTDAEKQGLIDLFNKMKNMNIDWNQVKNDLVYVSERLQDFMKDERTQGIMKNIIDGLIAFLNWLKGLFGAAEA
ncbi:DUF1002 domain-containing protein [Schinkia azotoformans]|uniref:Secreted protein n=1 Tax=Schinkia azotoformans LMG 9581 TaxID=1131731 RepID=K6CS56_SCHAZ|nr:DUF1002 domain-containing protein [Schinkia azotoformans]EKN63067.1 secreted protein [Schinkia azotoformans LMG 9581]MEC1640700.1 DUF1002 domain-containing protein [Schinkia azotoformans]MEC1945157.1 DUF1002 domain-containing protein [Schinkia azotoformans]